MARIEDYALIGDCQTAALVGRDGSIDWLCLPRFDAGACFAALLGTPANGRWLLAPAGEVRATRPRYRGDTLLLETEEGIWEVRGPRRHFTHSKVMAWVAFDRAVKTIEGFGLDGPVDRWRTLRDTIHAEVCQRGFNTDLGSFVQYYGSDRLDASLLMIPLVGFLLPADPRVRGTVDAIQRRLVTDGFVARYQDTGDVDGLPPGEGAFLACTFWWADNLVLLGRHAEARRIFERLLALRNDVGLLSEEYDPRARRLVGNFPPAFSHVGLVNTAHNLTQAEGPAQQRLQS
jgi:GH15 family glucan-1,4-alpha-glucosidase